MVRLRPIWFTIATLLFAHVCRSQAVQTTAQTAEVDREHGEAVQLSEILIATPQPYDPAQVEDARLKAEALRAAIAGGSTFSDIAKANSQGSTASDGGRIGTFYRGELAPALEKLVFQMRVSDVSEVIRTKPGFIILQVTGKAAPEVRDDPLLVLNVPPTAELRGYLDDMRKRIRQRWYALIPPVAFAPEKKQGTMKVRFQIGGDGSITEAKLLSSTGDSALDKAALEAILECSPFPPLAGVTKADHLVLESRFEYNPEKNPKPQN